MKKKILAAKNLLSKLTLPYLPEEIFLLQEELSHKYPNTANVANLISHNPELLADFLQLVNSNITLKNEPIREAKAAVNVLGLDEIYNIYFSSAISKMLTQSYAEKQILKHGTKAGIAAAELSYWVEDITRAEAYFAALIQNIGAVFMARVYAEQYLDIFERQFANPISRFQQEEELYGTNHAIVGTLVSKHWNVSDEVYKSILFHHNVNFAKETHHQPRIKHLISLTMLSNYVVSSALDTNYITQELKEYRDVALKELDLPENAIKAAQAAVNKWGNSIGIANSSH